MIRRHHVWRTDGEGNLTGSGRQLVTLNNGTKAWVTDQGDGWFVELAVPLKDRGLDVTKLNSVGFNIRLNDDDDGGERDHALTWSVADRQQRLTTGEGASGVLRFAPVAP
jgi:hypothetical protein